MNITISGLFIIYIALFCCLWIMMFLRLMWMSRRLVVFADCESDTPVNWPKLSVIVPACNEADHIEEAVKSLLTQDYPYLEIILINDRSVDNTGEILERLATDDDRIKVVHINNLPEGWLGKVNALDQGVQRATGDWLLFTDADIHFSHDMLRRAVAYSLQNEIDHLALLPSIITKDFWLSVMIHSFGLMFLLSTRAHTINDTESKAFIGVGAFNLVRRKIFEKTPGFEWLRMEVVDDVGLGMMLKQAGGKTHFALADGDLRITWYHSVGAMFKGLEKNSFGPGPRYRLHRLIFLLFIMLSLVISPLLALVSGSQFLMWLGLASIVIFFIFSVFFVREKQTETLSLLLFPVGLLLFCLVMIRAAFKCIRNRGIDWRGTHYSIEELRDGQRVKL